jgi:DNA-directed RNA polymerase subunit RPC12/RpoP
LAKERTVIRYVCQFCGYEGVDEQETSLDRVLCEMCGEPAAEQR